MDNDVRRSDATVDMRMHPDEARNGFAAAFMTIAVILSLCTPAGPAMALVSLTVDISAAVTGNASNCNGTLGGFSYNYTVTNLATAAPLLDFMIPLSNVSDVCNIQAPAGWTDFFNGTDLVFQATSMSAYLQAGAPPLSGFVLDSPLPGTDEMFTADLIGPGGQIISVPVDPLAPLRLAAPEPSTVALLAAGLLGTGYIRRRRTGLPVFRNLLNQVRRFFV